MEKTLTEKSQTRKEYHAEYYRKNKEKWIQRKKQKRVQSLKQNSIFKNYRNFEFLTPILGSFGLNLNLKVVSSV